MSGLPIPLMKKKWVTDNLTIGFPGAWYAPTWSSSVGKVFNTPTVGVDIVTDGNMEAVGVANWPAYGSPGTREKSAVQVHGGAQSLHVITDATFEGVNQIPATAAVVGTWYFWDVWGYNAGAVSPTLYGVAAQWHNTPTKYFPAASWVEGVVTSRALTNSARFYLTQLGGGAVSEWYFDDMVMKPMTLSTLFASRPCYKSNFDLIAPPMPDFATVTQAGVALCMDSPTAPANCVIAYCDGMGAVRTDQLLAGTWSSLGNVAAVYGATKYFSVKKNGTSVSIYYGTTDFGTLISTVAIDSSIASYTRHGLFSTYSGNTFSGTFKLRPYSP